MRRRSDTLSPEDPAPAFTLPTQRGEPRTLADAVSRGPVIVAFHRGTW